MERNDEFFFNYSLGDYIHDVLDVQSSDSIDEIHEYYSNKPRSRPTVWSIASSNCGRYIAALQMGILIIYETDGFKSNIIKLPNSLQKRVSHRLLVWTVDGMIILSSGVDFSLHFYSINGQVLSILDIHKDISLKSVNRLVSIYPYAYAHEIPSNDTCNTCLHLVTEPFGVKSFSYLSNNNSLNTLNTLEKSKYNMKLQFISDATLCLKQYMTHKYIIENTCYNHNTNILILCMHNTQSISKYNAVTICVLSYNHMTSQQQQQHQWILLQELNITRGIIPISSSLMNSTVTSATVSSSSATSSSSSSFSLSKASWLQSFNTLLIKSSSFMSFTAKKEIDVQQILQVTSSPDMSYIVILHVDGSISLLKETSIKSSLHNDTSSHTAYLSKDDWKYDIAVDRFMVLYAHHTSPKNTTCSSSAEDDTCTNNTAEANTTSTSSENKDNQSLSCIQYTYSIAFISSTQLYAISQDGYMCILQINKSTNQLEYIVSEDTIIPYNIGATACHVYNPQYYESLYKPNQELIQKKNHINTNSSNNKSDKWMSYPNGYPSSSINLLIAVDTWTSQIFSMTFLSLSQIIRKKIQEGLFQEASMLAIKYGYQLDKVYMLQWEYLTIHNVVCEEDITLILNQVSAKNHTYWWWIYQGCNFRHTDVSLWKHVLLIILDKITSILTSLLNSEDDYNDDNNDGENDFRGKRDSCDVEEEEDNDFIMKRIFHQSQSESLEFNSNKEVNEDQMIIDMLIILYEHITTPSSPSSSVYSHTSATPSRTQYITGVCTTTPYDILYNKSKKLEEIIYSLNTQYEKIKSITTSTYDSVNMGESSSPNISTTDRYHYEYRNHFIYMLIQYHRIYEIFVRISLLSQLSDIEMIDELTVVNGIHNNLLSSLDKDTQEFISISDLLEPKMTSSSSSLSYHKLDRNKLSKFESELETETETETATKATTTMKNRGENKLLSRNMKSSLSSSSKVISHFLYTLFNDKHPGNSSVSDNNDSKQKRRNSNTYESYLLLPIHDILLGLAQCGHIQVLCSGIHLYSYFYMYELTKLYDILDAIPEVIDPTTYSHLLPIINKNKIEKTYTINFLSNICTSQSHDVENDDHRTDKEVGESQDTYHTDIVNTPHKSVDNLVTQANIALLTRMNSIDGTIKVDNENVIMNTLGCYSMLASYVPNTQSIQLYSLCNIISSLKVHKVIQRRRSTITPNSSSNSRNSINSSSSSYESTWLSHTSMINGNIVWYIQRVFTFISFGCTSYAYGLLEMIITYILPSSPYKSQLPDLWIQTIQELYLQLYHYHSWSQLFYSISISDSSLVSTQSIHATKYDNKRKSSNKDPLDKWMNFCHWCQLSLSERLYHFTTLLHEYHGITDIIHLYMNYLLPIYETNKRLYQHINAVQFMDTLLNILTFATDNDNKSHHGNTDTNISQSSAITKLLEEDEDELSGGKSSSMDNILNNISSMKSNILQYIVQSLQEYPTTTKSSTSGVISTFHPLTYSNSYTTSFTKIKDLYVVKYMSHHLYYIFTHYLPYIPDHPHELISHSTTKNERNSTTPIISNMSALHTNENIKFLKQMLNKPDYEESILLILIDSIHTSIMANKLILVSNSSINNDRASDIKVDMTQYEWVLLSKLVQLAQGSKHIIPRNERYLKFLSSLKYVVINTCLVYDVITRTTIEYYWQLIECTPANNIVDKHLLTLFHLIDEIQRILSISEILLVYMDTNKISLSFSNLMESSENFPGMFSKRRQFKQQLLQGCLHLAPNILNDDTNTTTTTVLTDSDSHSNLHQHHHQHQESIQSIDAISSQLNIYECLILHLCTQFGEKIRIKTMNQSAYDEDDDEDIIGENNGSNSSSSSMKIYNEWVKFFEDIQELCRLSPSSLHNTQWVAKVLGNSILHYYNMNIFISVMEGLHIYENWKRSQTNLTPAATLSGPEDVTGRLTLGYILGRLNLDVYAFERLIVLKAIESFNTASSLNDQYMADYYTLLDALYMQYDDAIFSMDTLHNSNRNDNDDGIVLDNDENSHKNRMIRTLKHEKYMKQLLYILQEHHIENIIPAQLRLISPLELLKSILNEAPNLLYQYKIQYIPNNLTQLHNKSTNIANINSPNTWNVSPNAYIKLVKISNNKISTNLAHELPYDDILIWENALLQHQPHVPGMSLITFFQYMYYDYFQPISTEIIANKSKSSPGSNSYALNNISHVTCNADGYLELCKLYDVVTDILLSSEDYNSVYRLCMHFLESIYHDDHSDLKTSAVHESPTNHSRSNTVAAVAADSDMNDDTSDDYLTTDTIVNTDKSILYEYIHVYIKKIISHFQYYISILQEELTVTVNTNKKNKSLDQHIRLQHQIEIYQYLIHDIPAMYVSTVPFDYVYDSSFIEVLYTKSTTTTTTTSTTDFVLDNSLDNHGSIYEDMSILSSHGILSDDTTILYTIKSLLKSKAMSILYPPGHPHHMLSPIQSSSDYIHTIITPTTLSLPSILSYAYHLKETTIIYDFLYTLYMELKQVFSHLMSSYSSTMTDIGDIDLNNNNIVKQLIQKGFHKNGARRAVISTHNTSYENALKWAIEHSMDKDFEHPYTYKVQGSLLKTTSSLTGSLATNNLILKVLNIPIDDSIRPETVKEVMKFILDLRREYQGNTNTIDPHINYDDINDTVLSLRNSSINTSSYEIKDNRIISKGQKPIKQGERNKTSHMKTRHSNNTLNDSTSATVNVTADEGPSVNKVKEKKVIKKVTKLRVDNKEDEDDDFFSVKVVTNASSTKVSPISNVHDTEFEIRKYENISKSTNYCTKNLELQENPSKLLLGHMITEHVNDTQNDESPMKNMVNETVNEDVHVIGNSLNDVLDASKDEPVDVNTVVNHIKIKDDIPEAMSMNSIELDEIHTKIYDSHADKIIEGYNDDDFDDMNNIISIDDFLNIENTSDLLETANTIENTDISDGHIGKSPIPSSTLIIEKSKSFTSLFDKIDTTVDKLTTSTSTAKVPTSTSLVKDSGEKSFSSLFDKIDATTTSIHPPAPVPVATEKSKLFTSLFDKISLFSSDIHETADISHSTTGGDGGVGVNPPMVSFTSLFDKLGVSSDKYHSSEMPSSIHQISSHINKDDIDIDATPNNNNNDNNDDDWDNWNDDMNDESKMSIQNHSVYNGTDKRQDHSRASQKLSDKSILNISYEDSIQIVGINDFLNDGEVDSHTEVHEVMKLDNAVQSQELNTDEWDDWNEDTTTPLHVPISTKHTNKEDMRVHIESDGMSPSDAALNLHVCNDKVIETCENMDTIQMVSLDDFLHSNSSLSEDTLNDHPPQTLMDTHNNIHEKNGEDTIDITTTTTTTTKVSYDNYDVIPMKTAQKKKATKVIKLAVSDDDQDDFFESQPKSVINSNSEIQTLSDSAIDESISSTTTSNIGVAIMHEDVQVQVHSNSTDESISKDIDMYDERSLTGLGTADHLKEKVHVSNSTAESSIQVTSQTLLTITDKLIDSDEIISIQVIDNTPSSLPMNMNDVFTPSNDVTIKIESQVDDPLSIQNHSTIMNHDVSTTTLVNSEEIYSEQVIISADASDDIHTIKLIDSEDEAKRAYEYDLDRKRLAEIEAEARRIVEAEFEAKRLADLAKKEAKRLAKVKRLEKAKKEAEKAEALRIVEECEARTQVVEAEAFRKAEEKMEVFSIVEEIEARRYIETNELVDKVDTCIQVEEVESKQVTDEVQSGKRPAELEANRLAQIEAHRLAEIEAEARRVVEAEFEAKRLADLAKKEARRLAKAKRLEKAKKEAETEALQVAEQEAKVRRLAEDAKAHRLVEETEARRLAEAVGRRQAEEAETSRIAEEVEAHRLAEEQEGSPTLAVQEEDTHTMRVAGESDVHIVPQQNNVSDVSEVKLDNIIEADNLQVSVDGKMYNVSYENILCETVNYQSVELSTIATTAEILNPKTSYTNMPDSYYIWYNKLQSTLEIALDLVNLEISSAELMLLLVDNHTDKLQYLDYIITHNTLSSWQQLLDTLMYTDGHQDILQLCLKMILHSNIEVYEFIIHVLQPLPTITLVYILVSLKQLLSELSITDFVELRSSTIIHSEKDVVIPVIMTWFNMYDNMNSSEVGEEEGKVKLDDTYYILRHLELVNELEYYLYVIRLLSCLAIPSQILDSSSSSSSNKKFSLFQGHTCTSRHIMSENSTVLLSILHNESNLSLEYTSSCIDYFMTSSYGLIRFLAVLQSIYHYIDGNNAQGVEFLKNVSIHVLETYKKELMTVTSNTSYQTYNKYIENTELLNCLYIGPHSHIDKQVLVNMMSSSSSSSSSTTTTTTDFISNVVKPLHEDIALIKRINRIPESYGINMKLFFTTDDLIATIEKSSTARTPTTPRTLLLSSSADSLSSPAINTPSTTTALTTVSQKVNPTDNNTTTATTATTTMYHNTNGITRRQVSLHMLSDYLTLSLIPIWNRTITRVLDVGPSELHYYCLCSLFKRHIHTIYTKLLHDHPYDSTYARMEIHKYSLHQLDELAYEALVHELIQGLRKMKKPHFYAYLYSILGCPYNSEKYGNVPYFHFYDFITGNSSVYTHSTLMDNSSPRTATTTTTTSSSSSGMPHDMDDKFVLSVHDGIIFYERLEMDLLSINIQQEYPSTSSTINNTTTATTTTALATTTTTTTALATSSIGNGSHSTPVTPASSTLSSTNTSPRELPSTIRRIKSLTNSQSASNTTTTYALTKDEFMDILQTTSRLKNFMMSLQALSVHQSIQMRYHYLHTN